MDWASTGGALRHLRVGPLAADATLAGAANVGDLGERGTGPDASRDMLRRLLKGSKWPTVLNPTTGDDEVHTLPMVLPH